LICYLLYGLVNFFLLFLIRSFHYSVLLLFFLVTRSQKFFLDINRSNHNRLWWRNSYSKAFIYEFCDLLIIRLVFKFKISWVWDQSSLDFLDYNKVHIWNKRDYLFVRRILPLKLLLNSIDFSHVVYGIPRNLGDVDELHDWVSEGLDIIATTHSRTVKGIYRSAEWGPLETVLTRSLVLLLAVHIFHGQAEI
jgi:hypothetical protein